MPLTLSHQELTSRAASLGPRGQAFIGGAYVDAASGKTFDSINPATGAVLTRIAQCDVEDVNRAVKAARASFESGAWSSAAPGQRKKTLLKFADLIEANALELALLETLDMGKPIRDSSSIDIPSSAGTIRWYAEAVDKVYDEIAPTGSKAISLVQKVPMGVVAAVVPWNFPLLLSTWKIAPALATGNSVILKPAEQSSLTAIRVAELALEAGIPAGVFNVVPGFGESAGQALGMHMDVDAISFTGSTEVGKKFLVYAGRSNMKRVSLECGGKTPNIIMADAPDLDAAATAAAWGIFFNQGEVCDAGSRLLLQDPIKDRVLEKISAVAKTLRPGDPLDPQTRMGAIVDKAQMDRVLGYIDSGKTEGANLRLGGQRIEASKGGYFIEPTIFDNVKNSMRIAQEEIFGPVLSVITFRDAEEAVGIANDSIYGLAAGVWTSNINTAFTMAQRLRAGVVGVNCLNPTDIASPFGGFKQSGIGRDKSIHAMAKYTETKTTWINLGGD